MANGPIAEPKTDKNDKVIDRQGWKLNHSLNFNQVKVDRSSEPVVAQNFINRQPCIGVLVKHSVQQILHLSAKVSRKLIRL